MLSAMTGSPFPGNKHEEDEPLYSLTKLTSCYRQEEEVRVSDEGTLIQTCVCLCIAFLSGHWTIRENMRRGFPNCTLKRKVSVFVTAPYLYETNKTMPRILYHVLYDPASFSVLSSAYLTSGNAKLSLSQSHKLSRQHSRKFTLEAVNQLK